MLEFTAGWVVQKIAPVKKCDLEPFFKLKRKNEKLKTTVKK
ncbi:MAG: hypothetical protein WCT49_01455 [Candidatus Paceibacterota bacterium]|jgi:hypothetical protein